MINRYLRISIIAFFVASVLVLTLKYVSGASNPDAKEQIAIANHALSNHELNITMIKEDIDAFNYLEQACIKKDIKLKYCKTIIALIDEFNIPWNHEGVDLND